MSKYDNYGGYFAPKGVMRVEAGGAHAENPNGGVQIGMDEQGVPNLLEEGEPVFNDYVFSDNIYAKGGVLKKFNIPERFAGKLYSEIADYYINEVDGMELDPIANRGLNANLVRLMNAQEEQKMEKERRELEKMLAQMSPEELAALEQELAAAEGGQEMPVQEQVPADQQMMAQAPVEEAAPMEMPVEQAPLMAACGGPIHRFDMGGPAGEGRGGAYLPGYDNGTTLDLYGGILDPVVATAYPGKTQAWVDAETSGIKRKIAEGSNQFLADAYDAYQHNPAAKVIVNGMMMAGTGGATLSKEKIVGEAMDKAYEGLAKEAAKTTTKEVAKEAAKETAKATVKRPHWSQWFVDPGYYWRGGAPEGWLSKGLAGLHSAAVGGAELTGAGSMVGEIIERRGDRKSPIGSDPFSSGEYEAVGGYRWNGKGDGGHLYWPGGNLAFWNPYALRNSARAGLHYSVDTGTDAGTTTGESRLSQAAKGLAPDWYNIGLGYRYSPTVGNAAVSNISNRSNTSQAARDMAPSWFNMGLGYRYVGSGDRQLGAGDGFALGRVTSGAKTQQLTPQEKAFYISPVPLSRVDNGLASAMPSASKVLSDELARRSSELVRKKPAPSDDEIVVDNPGRGLLTTLPRYAGVVGNSIAALSDAFAKPDSMVQNYAQPVLPVGRMDLQPVVYNPTDMNHLANMYAAQMTGANRMLRNSGLGPSVGANIIAANNSGMQNLGSALLQGRAANNQLMNNVITANNQSAAQKANFDYTLDAARANILNDYRYRRAMNDMNVQQYNNAQDTAKWTALGQQLGNVWQGLSDMGNENFAMNQVNSNPALFYRTTQNGGVYYDPMHSDYLEYWRDYFAKHPEKLNGKKTEGGK